MHQGHAVARAHLAHLCQQPGISPMLRLAVQRAAQNQPGWDGILLLLLLYHLFSLPDLVPGMDESP